MQTLQKAILFTGPMRSSKTTSLLSQYESARDGGIVAGFFRPKFDDRDTLDAVKSRGGYTVPVRPTIVETALELYELAQPLGFVGIEEVQFFEEDKNFLTVVELLYQEGKELAMAGLDLDWLGDPWPMTRDLMAKPFVKVIKKRAICVISKTRTATLTQKLHLDGTPVAITENSKRMETGDAQYRPLCRTCWYETTPGAAQRLVLPNHPQLVLPLSGNGH